MLPCCVGTVMDLFVPACQHCENIILVAYSQLLFLFQALEDEEKMTPEQLAIKNVGKQDPKRHLEEKVDVLMSANIVQCLGAMLDTVVFK